MLHKISSLGLTALLLLATTACTPLPAGRQQSPSQPQEQPPTNVPTPSVQVPSGKLLDLSNRGLERIPSDTFNRTGLEELNVSGNRLTGAIQAEIRNLKNLKVLNARNNLMTGVPAEIGQLSNLRVLDLSNNQLTGLPYELGNLTNLQTLNLSGNDYSKQDLDIIQKTLPNTNIIVD